MTIEKKFMKYGKSPDKFVEDYPFGICRISGRAGYLPIQKFQIDMVNDIHKNNYTVIKKSRQMYVTYTTCAYIAWCMIFKIEYQVGLFSVNKESSVRNLKTIKDIIQNFYGDELWKNELIVDNKSELRLANGSFAHAFAPNKDAGRGYRVDFLFIDEAAFIKNLKEIWAGIFLLLNNKSKIVITSTPNAAGDLFHQLWEGSILKENDYHPINLIWNMNPHYTKMHEIRNNKPWSPWFENQCHILGNNQNRIDSELWGMFIPCKRTDVTNRINFRINSETYKKIMDKIESSGISLTNYMMELVNKDLEDE